MTAQETTEVLDDEAGPPTIREYLLSVEEGPDAGREHRAARPRTVIGTHRSADLVLSDRGMSRFHCEIVLENGQPVIRDLGSRNGTRIDGVAVLAAPLRDGMRLQLGRSQLRFRT